MAGPWLLSHPPVHHHHCYLSCSVPLLPPHLLSIKISIFYFFSLSISHQVMVGQQRLQHRRLSLPLHTTTPIPAMATRNDDNYGCDPHHQSHTVGGDNNKNIPQQWQGQGGGGGGGGSDVAAG